MALGPASLSIASDAYQAVTGTGSDLTSLQPFYSYLHDDTASEADLDSFLSEARNLSDTDHWSTYDLDARIAASGHVPPSPAGEYASMPADGFTVDQTGTLTTLIGSMSPAGLATSALKTVVAVDTKVQHAAEAAVAAIKRALPSLPNPDSILKWIKVALWVVGGAVVLYIAAQVYLLTRRVQKA